MPAIAEADENQNANHAEDQSNRDSQTTGETLCIHGCGQTPLAEKIPEADPEVKGGSKDPDHRKREKPRIVEEMFDFNVGGFAMCQPALGIEVPADVHEG